MKLDDPDPEQEMSVSVKDVHVKKTMAADAVLALTRLVVVLVMQFCSYGNC
jgi:hypothetical protein